MTAVPDSLDPTLQGFVCTHVREGELPVLVVSRLYDELDPEDGPDWMFSCGAGDHGPHEVVTAPVGEVLTADPSLGDIVDLQPQETAEREAPGEPWTRAEPGEPCALCGRSAAAHGQDPRFVLPDRIAALPDREYTPGIAMTGETAEDSVLLKTEHEGFIRATLPVRLVGGLTVEYGLWVAISPLALERASEAWTEPEYADLRLAGTLANAIPPWGLLDAPVQLAVPDPDELPVCVASTDPELRTVLAGEFDHDFVLGAVGL
ncbi:DUF2199 domain-containing protein [Nakamurella deserti]|uniref:DUF2199 domain-containing protein n=1 Tax=Nakamurella deserti TaxID=2164074 RepID=UPI000DBE39F7|nr:DUF2199 domain-containing protein [Nakamurella deserti]